jgi:hypothetical protein
MGRDAGPQLHYNQGMDPRLEQQGGPGYGHGQNRAHAPRPQFNPNYRQPQHHFRQQRPPQQQFEQQRQSQQQYEQQRQQGQYHRQYRQPPAPPRGQNEQQRFHNQQQQGGNFLDEWDNGPDFDYQGDNYSA